MDRVQGIPYNWRVTNWEQLIGHEWAVQQLREALRNDHVGHAYLITGQAHIGKTTLARTFAQALNCTADDVAARPCGQCRTCQLIAADRHPDVRLVEGETSSRGRLSLKIEQIRALQQELNLAPYEARTKVAILRRFDAANPSAANAFLKTLEEPPGEVILLLTADNADSLLPTITSRCRVLSLRPIPQARIATALQARWGVEPAEARRLAHLAGGRLGWAVNAVTTPEALQARDGALESLHQALGGSRVTRFGLADKLSRQPDVLPELLQTWLTWWRDLALLALGSDNPDALTNIDHLEHLRRVAAAWTKADVVVGFKQTHTALWQLERNANTRLVVENLLLAYPLPDKTPPSAGAAG